VSIALENENNIVDNTSVSHFELYQNYPNPFNPHTNIEFYLDRISKVKLNVYDIKGRLVKDLISNEIVAGHHKITFDGSALASGVYFCEINVNDFKDIKKIIMLR